MLHEQVSAACSTPSGRLLTGTVSGSESAPPVLYIAGAATGRSMRFGVSALVAGKMRLLTMDRPGLGGSTHDPGRTVKSTAEDYRIFATSVLGLERPFSVVANSQGALFGLAMAAAGWTAHLTLVSPADEVAHPAVHDLIPEDAQELVRLVAHRRDSAAQLLESMNAATMEQMVLEGASAVDRACYSHPSFLTDYRTALREGFAQEGRGYVQDTLMAMSPWPLEWTSLRCPVHILFGAEDRSHSPDLGEHLGQRIPEAHRRVVDGAGGALLWSHTAFVLEACLATDAGIAGGRAQPRIPSS